MELDELLKMQTDDGVRDHHLVYIGEDGFRIAHTDEERASDKPLDECELHRWLCEFDEAPVKPGVYLAFPYEADHYSEPYGADPWDLEPFPWSSQ